MSSPIRRVLGAAAISVGVVALGAPAAYADPAAPPGGGLIPPEVGNAPQAPLQDVPTDPYFLPGLDQPPVPFAPLEFPALPL